MKPKLTSRAARPCTCPYRTETSAFARRRSGHRRRPPFSGSGFLMSSSGKTTSVAQVWSVVRTKVTVVERSGSALRDRERARREPVLARDDAKLARGGGRERGDSVLASDFLSHPPNEAKKRSAAAAAAVVERLIGPYWLASRAVRCKPGANGEQTGARAPDPAREDAPAEVDEATLSIHPRLDEGGHGFPRRRSRPHVPFDPIAGSCAAARHEAPKP